MKQTVKHTAKQILDLAAWNWRLARKGYLALCAAFALQQLAVLLALAAFGGTLGAGLAHHYVTGLQWLALAIAFLAAGLLAARCLWPGGKARSRYTWLTLPLPPSVRLAALAVTAAVMELGLLAWQLVLYWLYYWPVTVLESAIAQQTLQVAGLPAQNMYEQFTRNPVLVSLLPTRPGQLFTCLALVLAAAVLLPILFVHKGWRRLVAALLTAVAAIACCAMLALERYITQVPTTQSAPTWFRLCPIIILAVVFISWGWALRSIRHAELV